MYYIHKIQEIERQIQEIEGGYGDFAELVHLRRALQTAKMRRLYFSIPQEATLPPPVHNWIEEGF